MDSPVEHTPSNDPAKAPPAPVFISHSSRDAEAAMQVVVALESAGVPCWVAPRDVPAGSDWNHSIMTGIVTCPAMVLVYTRHSVDSDPVKREVERALSRKIPVIPVRLEQTPPSPAMEYMISTAQWVDAHPPPIDRHLNTVVAAVRKALNLAHETPKPDPNAPPQYVGPYRVLEKLGEGGMGAVYKAEQRSPVKRTVALKLIRPGLSTQEVLARFESERQALARMNHPNVARVLDAGVDEQGRPYFAMEYVPGTPITRFADDNKLSIKKRLELFKQVCDAIAHAHTKSLLHRDIKPTNVLAYLDDGKPMVKVIDFGIAKALTGDKLTDRTFSTERGLAVGTYESMSPEQAEGSPDIDTRTDVYSLGVLLYELLTGAKPFDEQTLKQAADHEIRRMIREVDPPRPSTRLSSLGESAAKIAAARQEQLEALAGRLRRELEWIPLMAMRKERDRRYASPMAFAEDIQNYLDGKPLEAAPDSMNYRLRKYFRRNRGPIAAALTIIILLVCGIAGTTAGLIGQSRERVRAQRQEHYAEERRKDAENAKAIARAEAAEALRQGYFASIAAATVATERLQLPLAREFLDATAPTQRLWEWGYLRAQTDTSVGTFCADQPLLSCLAFSPDGSLLATGSENGETRLWDTQTQTLRVTLPKDDYPIHSITFSPDGMLVATAGGAIRLWNIKSGQEHMTLFGRRGTVRSVAFSPDGTRLVSGSEDTTAQIWDVETGQILKVLQGHENHVQSVAFSPDGRRVATASGDTTARVWDVAGGTPILTLRGHVNGIDSICFSPDGRRLATGSMDNVSYVWDGLTGRSIAKLHRHDKGVSSVAFSPDGAYLVTGSYDRTCRIWDIVNWREVAVLRGHDGVIRCVAYSPDGSRVATASRDGTVRIWLARGSDPSTELPGHTKHEQIDTAAFSPDRHRLVTAVHLVFSMGHKLTDNMHLDAAREPGEVDDPTARVWNLPDGTEFKRLKGHSATIDAVVFSPDGTRLATVAGDNSARVWDAHSGNTVAVMQGEGEAVIHCVAFSPDGKWLATGSQDWSVCIWQAANGKLLKTLPGHQNNVVSVAFSADGKRLLSASQDDVARIWDTETGKELTTLAGVRRAKFSADGRFLMTAADDYVAYVRDASTLQEIAVLRGHDHNVAAMDFAPDGTRVATASADNTARIWETTSGRELATLRGHEDWLVDIAFSPDGTQVFTISADHVVRTWDSVSAAGRYKATGLPLLPRFVPTTQAATTRPQPQFAVPATRTADQPLVEDSVERATTLDLRRLDSGKPEVLAAILQKVLKTNLDGLDPLELATCCEYLVLAGKPDVATAATRRAVMEGDQLPYSLRLLCWSLVRQGDPLAAQTTYRESTLPTIRAALPEQAGDAKAVDDKFNAWTAAYLAGDATEADYLNHCEKIYPDAVWFYIGEKADVESRRDDALIAYRRAAEAKTVVRRRAPGWAAYRVAQLTGTDVPTTTQPTTRRRPHNAAPTTVPAVTIQPATNRPERFQYKYGNPPTLREWRRVPGGWLETGASRGPTTYHELTETEPNEKGMIVSRQPKNDLQVIIPYQNGGEIAWRSSKSTEWKSIGWIDVTKWEETSAKKPSSNPTSAPTTN
jgi:WD40 repeat protein/serine/threonine protein kinase